MAHRQFRRGAGGISRARETLWLDLPVTAATMTAAGGTLLLSLTTEELAMRPFTIIRTRITTLQRSDQTAASEDQIVGYGVAVVSEQAAAIGVTAIPTPLTDLASDLWLAHMIQMSSFGVATAVSAFNDTNQDHIDSKAMRKVNGDQDVVVVSELNTSGGSGATIFLAGRMLIKLH